MSLACITHGACAAGPFPIYAFHMKHAGMILMAAGAVLLIFGILLWSGWGLSWFGRLPGDIRIERPGFGISLPITTCILISIILSVIFYLLRMLK